MSKPVAYMLLCWLGNSQSAIDQHTEFKLKSHISSENLQYDEYGVSVGFQNSS